MNGPISELNTLGHLEALIRCSERLEDKYTVEEHWKAVLYFKWLRASYYQKGD